MRKRDTQKLRISRKHYTQFWRVSIVKHDAIIHSNDIISQRSSKQYNPVPILLERLLRRLPQAPMNTEFFCGFFYFGFSTKKLEFPGVRSVST